MKSIIDINIWLLQNQEYYDKISGICQMTCEDCAGKTIPYISGEKCIRNMYKKEFDFYVYYGTLVLLLELRTISDSCALLVNEYNSIPVGDISAVDFWCVKALKFSDNSFENCLIQDNIVYDDKGICIGVKPNYSLLYGLNPFLLPVEGFEHLIEFQEIFKKEFIIERTTLFPFPTNN